MSPGVNGELTNRHGMRFVNARISEEELFFWGLRASSLEEQTTMPIRDKKEMGFSGENGQPSFDSLLSKLESIDHYEWFFNLACATTEITEQRIQFAIADFVRSIQSFDSRFDIGMQMVDSAHFPFPNYTTTENLGENIFTGYENSGTCNA